MVSLRGYLKDKPIFQKTVYLKLYIYNYKTVYPKFVNMIKIFLKLVKAPNRSHSSYQSFEETVEKLLKVTITINH